MTDLGYEPRLLSLISVCLIRVCHYILDHGDFEVREILKRHNFEFALDLNGKSLSSV